MNVQAATYHATTPTRAQAPAPEQPPAAPAQDQYEGPTLMDTLKNMVGVTAFAAGPALAAAQWGLPGAAIGVGLSALAMYAQNRDRDIMVPFTATAAAVMTIPALIFGWPGAIASTAICAAYGYTTR